MSPNFWKWALFNAFVLALLLFDLGVLRRKSHDVKIKEALGWSAFWIGLALAFCGGIWYYAGRNRAFEFLTGYITEYSLSVDNIFVFILIFSYFKVAPAHRHKVLFWGIMGALAMRGLMILVGVELVHRFEWILFVFGAFLIFTGIKMAFHNDGDIDPGANPVVKLARRFLPLTQEYHGDHFLVVQNGKRYATPLFIVLLVIESSDLIFAVDSIPAIIGISKDSFIIYTSNVFAILGLRSLYFALAGIMDLFHYLKYALSFILTFVGAKMLIEYFFHYRIPIELSLGIIIASLVIAVLCSLRWPLPDEETPIDEAQEYLNQPESSDDNSVST
jgi:tellurite resistance protein TerC